MDNKYIHAPEIGKERIEPEFDYVEYRLVEECVWRLEGEIIMSYKSDCGNYTHRFMTPDAEYCSCGGLIRIEVDDE